MIFLQFADLPNLPKPPVVDEEEALVPEKLAHELPEIQHELLNIRLLEAVVDNDRKAFFSNF